MIVSIGRDTSRISTNIDSLEALLIRRLERTLVIRWPMFVLKITNCDDRSFFLSHRFASYVSQLSMNTSATINVFRLIYNPALCLPQATLSNFNQLPLPLSSAFASLPNGQKPDIRAVILDKDNCFAKPKDNTVYQPYNVCCQFHEGQAF